MTTRRAHSPASSRDNSRMAVVLPTPEKQSTSNKGHPSHFTVQDCTLPGLEAYRTQVRQGGCRGPPVSCESSFAPELHVHGRA